MLCLCSWRQWKREQQSALSTLSAVSAFSGGAQSTATVAAPAVTASTEGASVAGGGGAGGGGAAAAVTVPGGDAPAMPEGLSKMEQMKVNVSETLPWFLAAMHPCKCSDERLQDDLSLLLFVVVAVEEG